MTPGPGETPDIPSNLWEEFWSIILKATESETATIRILNYAATILIYGDGVEKDEKKGLEFLKVAASRDGDIKDHLQELEARKAYFREYELANKFQL